MPVDPIAEQMGHLDRLEVACCITKCRLLPTVLTRRGQK